MDFGGQYSFPGAQPYHQFMPIPPLTPSHSHSAASDDFNTSPPAVQAQPPSLQLCLYPPSSGASTNPSLLTTVLLVQANYETLPQNANEHFPAFDYAQGFNANPHPTSNGFPGPPTPPGHNVFTQHQQQQRHGSVSNVNNSGQAADSVSDDMNVTRGTSEEDDNMTPAQSRRKAQNRAAQRAFRERKEKHVKDLEAKLAGLEAAQQQASVENERLKRDLQKMSTENEILRATSHLGGSHKNSMSSEAATGPMRFNPTEFYSNVLQNHTNKTPSHRIVTADDGERLMAAGATWDFIISHDLFKKGLVDVGDVSERLKHLARCDGQGPVFSERSILTAIEQSVASGTDDLL
ncbi:hypothetical protein B0J13DRAFT_650917 [Dactylonectria estremocensis]|uniref:BZIP domain-containing protein n=1 Tax=Dactylonectria estremocensis TaxID=1079267 RepID=A0A9P9JA84_9HYPO|nr:hypothetical protein B0J13DRAFT_650917 [Dactylonectria estremocensis]